MKSCICCTALLLFFATAVCAGPGSVDPMRGNTPLAEEPRPPALMDAENKDIRRGRAYSMQPPTIPHKIDGYQIDTNANKCLFCHNRTRVEETQAIPLSVTHYMDRDGNVLATVSPRRYVCTSCHVTQVDAKPLVGNSFEDVDTVMAKERKAQNKPTKK